MYRYSRWQPAIAGAATEEELVAILNHYLAALHRAETDSLPEPCRVNSLRSSNEIAPVAVALTQCDLKAVPNERGALILAEMALTFTAGLAKLRSLRDSPPRG